MKYIIKCKKGYIKKLTPVTEYTDDISEAGQWGFPDPAEITANEAGGIVIPIHSPELIMYIKNRDEKLKALEEQVKNYEDLICCYKTIERLRESVDKVNHHQDAKTIQVNCEVCGKTFTAKVADRKRGWARCCCKSCAAFLRENPYKKQKR